MRGGFYIKLAWGGIGKNKRLYLPYILTCAGMVMMFYIVAFLSISGTIGGIAGGSQMQLILGWGTYVIGIFSLIFLFYTNSFLMRRRKKEFGLYNILGMGKWNLGRILMWETVLIGLMALAGGLAAGILFSKAAELVMVNILQGDVTFRMTLEPKAIGMALVMFTVIFLLLLLNSLRQIHLANPVELLRSETVGEKPPKANWFFAVLGVVILAAAYYIAVSVENPIEALAWFFVAVVMVVVATYLLFVAGSVTLCRFLQRRRNYYYKPNHFVAVSSMVYRMKRNGAGLASICILCTMVLVMLSGTACLYAGTEDSMRNRFPRNIDLDVKLFSAEQIGGEEVAVLRGLCRDAVEEQETGMQNVLDYSAASFAGYLQNGFIETDVNKAADFGVNDYDKVWQIFVIPIEDYNRLMDCEVVLQPGEALMYTTKQDYEAEEITVGEQTVRIVEQVDEFMDNGTDAMQVVSSMFLFVPDVAEYVAPLMTLQDYNGNPIVSVHWYYGFDLPDPDEDQIALAESLREQLQEYSMGNTVSAISLESAAEERAGFYALFGGLFFLGLLLGLVFVLGAVLIMYYKQVSEGYEDQSRFAIMQKVGMTRREIRRSINSQVRTVFFLPLAAAGIHLCFAFPIMRRMLVAFNLTNLRLLVIVTAGSFLVFALMYLLVYRMTSRAYYKIVSD